ncbi:MAG: BMC domain-containing protein [Verrucomicrobia bacterium]|nr:BMC domain-containing protein [Verrucomicrobiota bacterium]
MTDAIGLLEITGLTAAMVAIDAMTKAAPVRVIQVELNDLYGVCIKLRGPTAAISTAIETGRRTAGPMGGRPVADEIHRLEDRAFAVVVSPSEFNPLIQQEVVFQADIETEAAPPTEESKLTMNQESTFALGFIETQGFTAVFEAIDTACKAANVEVVGKEKLGGGYVTVIIKGELSAVTAAVDAGRAKVDDLGKLIAAHVIARPSQAVLSLLPKV